MIIRTISQLPKVQENTFLPEDSLFEVSVSRVANSGQNYISKACRYGFLANQLKTTVQNKFVNDFKLTDASQANINVRSIYETVRLLKEGKDNNNRNAVCTLNGSKSFSGEVKLTNANNLTFNNTTDAYDQCAATVKTIKNALNSSASRVGVNSNTLPVQFMFTNTTVGEEKIAKLNANGSSTLPYSGTLVLYGWLADTGVVDTAQCWVALKGKMSNGSWGILQLQPWILGARHANMQYVSFNVQVAAGMELRVETGFDINFKSSSYQLRDNTLVNNTMTFISSNLGPAVIGTLYY